MANVTKAQVEAALERMRSDIQKATYLDRLSLLDHWIFGYLLALQDLRLIDNARSDALGNEFVELINKRREAIEGGSPNSSLTLLCASTSEVAHD